MPGVLLCCGATQKHRWGGALAGVLLCSSLHQVFDRLASILFSCQCWHVGERLGCWLHPSTCDSAVSPCFHGCLAFLHGDFPPRSPPHIPTSHLSAVNISPRPEIVPQSLKSSCQPLHLPGDLGPCPGCVWIWQGLSDSHTI